MTGCHTALFCPGGLPGGYLSEDVCRDSGGHEDGAELLQQAALEHGLLAAGRGPRGVGWGHHHSHQLEGHTHTHKFDDQ